MRGAGRLSLRAPPGQTIGKIWRVGIMGYNATPANVELVLAAFREGLKAQGKLGNPDRPFLT
jgi:aspartate aminotransferase-like enzyme